MKFDIKTGTIKSKLIEISPFLMREEFIISDICKHARIHCSNLPHISYRFKVQEFNVILFFEGSTLRRMDLVMELFTDEEKKKEDVFEGGDEIKRKRMHDAWLFRQGIRKDEDYHWGRVKSCYERKTNSSFITVCYQQ